VVRSSSARKTFVGDCLELLEGVGSQPQTTAEWDAVGNAMAKIEHLADAQTQLLVASGAQAVGIYCGLARERQSKASTLHFDGLHTKLAGLLLRVYIQGSDAGGERDVEDLRNSVCAVHPWARPHLRLSHTTILA
jgi:hypothetical protein